MQQQIIYSADELYQLAEKNISNCEIVIARDIHLSCPVKLTNCKNARISVTNGASITGASLYAPDWQLFNKEKNIFCSKLDFEKPIRGLVIGQNKYRLCRYPNGESDDITKCGATMEDINLRLKDWNDCQDGFIRALHKNEWGGNTYKISGILNGKLQLKWLGDNNRGNELHKKHLIVENVFCELDSCGEFFFDKKAGYLYIVPKCLEDLDIGQIKLISNAQLFELNSCENIVFQDLKLKNTMPSLYDFSYYPITRSDWAIAKVGAFVCCNCKDIVFKDCKFDDIGSNCIFFSGYNERCKIDRCQFTSCGASGVIVFGEQSCCRDLSTWKCHKTTISDTAVGWQRQDFPKNIEISYCYFYNLGLYEKQSAAVSISVAQNISVKGCTIHHLPRAGINICDGTFGGHIIENNDVFDTVRETGDHGPFNSWGRDRFWSLGGYDTSGKKGEVKRKYVQLDAITPTLINHNRFCGIKGFGIDLDDGSSNYIITNNVCHNVGIKLREGFFRNIENNLLINAPLDVHCSYKNCGDIYRANVVICEKPIRSVLVNKGNGAIFDNNSFVSNLPKPKKYKNLTIDGSNKYIKLAEIDLWKQNFNNVLYSKITMDFGLTDAPKPNIEDTVLKASTSCKTEKGIKLCDIDDGVRTSLVLETNFGALVEKITPLSKWYIFGLRKNDVILSVDGKTIEYAKDVILSKVREIVLVRNHQKIVLKANRLNIKYKNN